MQMADIATEPEPYLSVVIRARNEARSLKDVFEALLAQRCSFQWEIIVVENESEDETVELCKHYQARVISIRQNEFTFGRALNLGIGSARGELILLCSAHSIPIGSYFLESAVAPFSDSKIAAARCLVAGYGEQTAAWYKARDIEYRSPEEQRTAESGTDWLSHYPSASCCVIRRSVWEQIPYGEQLESNEDKLWASEILSKGFKIRSSAEAVFVYNRQRGSMDRLRRTSRQFRALYCTKGYVPLPWPSFFLRVIRWALSAPLVAVKYFIQNVMEDINLVSIPLQAKFTLRPGSIVEYNRPISKR